jgi:hypothetical protein
MQKCVTGNASIKSLNCCDSHNDAFNKQKHVYPVTFNNGNMKSSVVVRGFRDTGSNVCVLLENSVPMEFLMPLNKTVNLSTICGNMSKTPLYKANVESPIVKGDITIALAPSWCNLPRDSDMIVGEDFGVPYGPLQAEVNQIICKKEKGAEKKSNRINIINNDMSDNINLSKNEIDKSAENNKMNENWDVSESLNMLNETDNFVDNKDNSKLLLSKNFDDVDVAKLCDLQKNDVKLRKYVERTEYVNVVSEQDDNNFAVCDNDDMDSFDLLSSGMGESFDKVLKDKVFKEIKKCMSTKPTLLIADFDKPFVLYVDASDVAVGSVLMQYDDNKILRPVCYFSKKLNTCQKNYSITDKEALALILSVRAFRIYLGSHTVVYTDHEPLKYIKSNAIKSHRLLRWSIELQGYDLEIKHIAGSKNIIADYLSRNVDGNKNCMCILHDEKGSKRIESNGDLQKCQVNSLLEGRDFTGNIQ